MSDANPEYCPAERFDGVGAFAKWRASPAGVAMMAAVILALDALIVVAAIASGWFWFRASRQQWRRISRHEALDHADFNRIVTGLNRAAILNARAALATAIAAGLTGVRLLLGYVP